MAGMLTELRRAVRAEDWLLPPLARPRVRVPECRESWRCLQRRGDYVCTRRGGHGGRHHAAGTNGDVYAVWGDGGRWSRCS